MNKYQGRRNRIQLTFSLTDLAFSAAIGTLFFSGCSSTPASSTGEKENHRPTVQEQLGAQGAHPTGPFNQRERQDYRQIESLYMANNIPLAEEEMNSFIQQHPRSTLIASVENLHGLLLLRNKNPLQAIGYFKRAIHLSHHNQNFNQYVLYNLASAQFDADQIDDAQRTLTEINTDSLDKGNRLKVYYLRANIYQKRSLSLEASRELLTAGRLLSDATQQDNRKVFAKLLDQSLQNISDIAVLERLRTEFDDSAIADVLLFRLGAQEIALGNTGSGEIHLKSLISRFPESYYGAQAKELLSNSENLSMVDSNAVGVLLPLKGKFSKFGIRSLQAIQMAFGIFDPASSHSKLKLIVEDSGDDPDQAMKALHRLVMKDHVIAVIGPLLSKGADQITERAQELGIPLISLSRRAGPPEDYVFQGGLTLEMQAYEIARYAIQKMGAKRFAILYPREKIAREMSDRFWDAVESLGGKIVGIESYDPGETDFRQAVDKLSGLYYTEARQRELDLLAKAREENHITRRTRKTEQYYALKPIPDYDAVFIPDVPKVAGQILPTFAYRDVEHIQFLGTSAWDSSEFITRAQTYAEQSTFVDAFFPTSASPQVKRFIEQYKSIYKVDPISLEALAYDAGMILENVLSSSDGSTRPEVRDRLKAVHNFPGITGQITYKDSQFFRNLRIISVRNGQFVEMQ